MSKLTLSVVAMLGALASAAVAADTVAIQAQVTTFSPEIVFVNPGDTLAFRRMATHLVGPVNGMAPAGAAHASALGKDYDYKVEKEGIYVYRCTVHWAARMGGVVVAGKPANAKEIVEKYKAAATGLDVQAKFLLDKLLAELPKHGL